MRAFVTGDQGFAGTWLRRHLEQEGDEVTGAGSELDITDADFGEALVSAQPDAVYHLAAQSSVESSWEDPARTFAVNVLGTVNLLEAARACRQKPRVLLISSVEVYGSLQPSQLPVAEGAPIRPVNPYAASKAAGELAGLQAYLGRHLEVIRVRPFNHIGPGQSTRFFVPAMAEQIVEAAVNGTSILQAGNLTVRRDFTDVRDMVRAYRLLIERGTPGEVYNVCSGRSVRLEDVARRLLALAGIELTLTVDRSRLRPADVPDIRGDPGLVRQTTGWEPRIDLDRTLADVLAERSATTPRGPAGGEPDANG